MINGNYFNINFIQFIIWAGACIIVPIVAKIFSGIKNYNDFLKLSLNEIEYKNNEKEGKFRLSQVRSLSIIKDSHNVLSKLKVSLAEGEVIIDLDEMELEAYYDTIEDFLHKTYKNLLQ